jgi:hypothetical protein
MSKTFQVLVIGKGVNTYYTKDLATERLNYFKSLGYEAYLFKDNKIPDKYHLDKYKEIGDKIVYEQHQKIIGNLK